MPHIQIKQAISADIDILVEISVNTFKQTFEDSNSIQDMMQYIDEKLSQDQLSSELSNPDSQFYFAYFGNELTGYLKINFGSAQTETKLPNAMEIERIYVLADFHGKNVGKCLLEKAFQIAKDRAADFVWLGVWEKNEKAIQFYGKNGFEVFDHHVFMLGGDRQIDIMMKKAIPY